MTYSEPARTAASRTRPPAPASSPAAPATGITVYGCGPLLDTEALVSALESGRLGGALLRLQELPNVVISPHTAYYTDHALSDIVENSIVNCLEFERGIRHE